MKKSNNYMVTAGATTCLIIVAVILLNVLVGAIGDRINLKLDMTSSKVLSFSDETKNVLSQLDTYVRIYSLLPEDAEYRVHMRGIIEKYETLSPHIKYSVIDSEKNPDFVGKYKLNGQPVTNDCIIFESDKRYKVVDTIDAIARTRDTSYLSAEKLFTSAIMNVISENAVKIGVVTGHGEIVTPKNIDYALSTVDLMVGDISEDITMLVVSTPQIDYNMSEIEKIDSFLDKGNSIQVLMSPGEHNAENFYGYLKEWGVELDPGYIVETDSNSHYTTQYELRPQLVEGNEITQDILLNKYNIIYPLSCAIKPNSNPYIVEKVILTTSEKAVINNIEIVDDEILPTEENPAQKYNVAVVLEKALDDGDSAKMFVSGTFWFLATEYWEQQATANEDFYKNTVSYLSGNEANIYIRAKNISTPLITLTEYQGYLYGALTVIVIPLIIIVVGFIIWVRRRHL